MNPALNVNIYFIQKMENILNTDDFGAQQKPITELGKNTVYFLPYLMGERSPHNDPQARGAFLGLSLDTPRHQLTQAVFEGVAFALQDCYQLALEQGIRVEQTSICGGGAKNPTILRFLRQRLPDMAIHTAAEEGFNTNALPAQAVAYLAARRLYCLPVSFPATTGVPEPMVCGELCEP